MQIREKYPEYNQKIETHMNSYIDLQLSNIEQSEMKLAEIFKKH